MPQAHSNQGSNSTSPPTPPSPQSAAPTTPPSTPTSSSAASSLPPSPSSTLVGSGHGSPPSSPSSVSSTATLNDPLAALYDGTIAPGQSFLDMSSPPPRSPASPASPASPTPGSVAGFYGGGQGNVRAGGGSASNSPGSSSGQGGRQPVPPGQPVRPAQYQSIAAAFGAPMTPGHNHSNSWAGTPPDPNSRVVPRERANTGGTRRPPSDQPGR